MDTLRWAFQLYLKYVGGVLAVGALLLFAVWLASVIVRWWTHRRGGG
jgi:hypothetical protein